MPDTYTNQLQTIYLDLVPGGLPPVAHVSQGDTGARKLVFRIMENGQLVYTRGLNAIVKGKKPDGAYFSYECDTGYDYQIIRGCTAQMTAAPGQTECELQLTTPTGILGTLNFILDVEADPTATATASASEMTQFQALANQANQYAVNAASSATSASNSASAAAQSAQSVANAYRYNPVTTANTDLDDYNTTGFYYFSSSYTPAHTPDDSASGLLLVSALGPNFTTNDYLKQIWFRQGPGKSWQMWTRIKGGTSGSTTWGDWYQYLTPQDITGAITGLYDTKLTASRAVAANNFGNIITADTTLAELNRLSGVTSNVQTQINGANAAAAAAATAAENAKVTIGMIIGNGGVDASISIPHGTFTNIGSFTLTTGAWLIIFTAFWVNQGQRGGMRQILMTDTEGSSSAIDYAKRDSVPASIENSTQNQIIALFNVTEASRTVYVTAYQDCGASTTVRPRYSSIRLGDPKTS